MSHTHIVGSILGAAIGDAIGLPYEGLSRRRAVKLFGAPDRHRFFFGRGMVSDDTEHCCMTAQSLIASGGNIDSFRRDLGWRFRWWLLGLPAGIGFATLRSILKLWMGYSHSTSGVFSGGNGPAMRAAILGAAFDDRQILKNLVSTSSRMTHTDPKAEYGAFAVALAAQMARQNETVSPDSYINELRSCLNAEGEELISIISGVAASVKQGQSTEAYADSIGQTKGVSGYMYHTVPVAIHAWLSHPRDFQSAVACVIRCGGDTDTTGAIVGGIVGCTVGKDGISAEWLDNLFEWPRTKSWMEKLGNQLASCIQAKSANRPIGLPFWGVFLRNVFFLMIVLYHGFRRLFPPY